MAKKRFYESQQDRMDERRGEERYINSRRNASEEGYLDNIYLNRNSTDGRYSDRSYSDTRYLDERRSRYGTLRGEYMRHDSEYTQEKRDAGMIGNDYNKIANLPTEVMMKPYPPCPAYMDWEMDDNIIGIDRQLSNDNARRRSGFDPHKF